MVFCLHSLTQTTDLLFAHKRKAITGFFPHSIRTRTRAIRSAVTGNLALSKIRRAVGISSLPAELTVRPLCSTTFPLPRSSSLPICFGRVSKQIGKEEDRGNGK